MAENGGRHMAGNGGGRQQQETVFAGTSNRVGVVVAMCESHFRHGCFCVAEFSCDMVQIPGRVELAVSYIHTAATFVCRSFLDRFDQCFDNVSSGALLLVSLLVFILV